MDSHAITAGQFLSLRDPQGQPSGLRLHYATAGDASKPVMLFLHGFPQAWFVWERLMGHFASQYFCVAPDLRGFNLSSKPEGVKAYQAKHIVDDLVQLIKHISPSGTPITLVAHDWGGAIAWNIAVHHAHLIKKLVAINSPHPVPFGNHLRPGGAQVAASAYMDWLCQQDSELALAKNNYALLEGFFHGMGQAPALWFTAAVRARYHAAWAEPSCTSDHPLTGSVNYYRATPLTPAKVAKLGIEMQAADWMVHVPTRIVWGEQDLALPVSLLDGIERCIPDLSVRRIPQGNHWLIDAMPDAVIAAMSDFV